MSQEYCSAIAQAANEPMLGTAKQNAAQFVLAVPKSKWLPKPVDMDGAAGELARLIEPLKGQAIFTMKNSTPDEEGALWLFPHGYRFDNLASDEYADLVDAVLDGRPILPPHEKLTGRHFVMVCGHGKRDAACAKFGGLILKALQETAPENIEVWESSHVGGHRFAATLVVQPSRRWYGWLTPQDVPALIEAIQQDKILLERYRGNASYPPPLQVAEVWGYEQLMTLNDINGTISLVNPKVDGNRAEVEVSLAVHATSQTYRVFLAGTPYSFRANTANDVMKERLVWHVTDIQQHGQDY